jgi:hypothetical protein
MKALIMSLTCLLLLGNPALANRVFVGAGASQIWINSDHPAIGSQTATGYHITGGFVWKQVGLDLTLGGANIDTGEVWDIYYPPDSAGYGIIDLGIKYYLHDNYDRRVIPWIGAGAALHLISWDSYVYSVNGSGFSLGAGIDTRLISNTYLRTGLKYHFFTSEDGSGSNSYDGGTVQADISVIWLFGNSLK